MNMLIAIFLMIALPVLAETNALAVCIRKDVKHPEKVLGKLKLQEYFGSTEIDINGLPVYYKLLPTSNDWWVVTFVIDVGTMKRPDKNRKDLLDLMLKNIPTSEKDKFEVVALGEDEPASLKEAGFLR